ncbi:MAG: extracellular solute-binding protein, partial [Cyanobacteria bacterium P01_A01_bin.83]
MSKKSALHLLTGLIIAGLFGCNPRGTSDSNKLEFWTMQLKPDFTKYFVDLNRTFEAQNELLELRWVDVSWSAMENKILSAISARTAPDVVNLNPKFASELATRNAWLDLEQVVSPEVKATYLPQIWQASTIEVCQASNCSEQTFGLPWYLTTTITIYNQQILNAAGIQQPPQT